MPSGSGNVTRWGIDHRETNPRSVLTRCGGNRRGLRHFDLDIAISEESEDVKGNEAEVRQPAADTTSWELQVLGCMGEG